MIIHRLSTERQGSILPRYGDGTQGLGASRLYFSRRNSYNLSIG